MNFLNLLSTSLKFFVKIFGKVSVFFFNFLFSLKTLFIFFNLNLLRILLFVIILIFDFFYNIFYLFYKNIIKNVLYVFNYFILRFKSLKLIIIKFDNSYLNLSKYKVNNLFYINLFNYSLIKNFYDIFFDYIFFLLIGISFLKNFIKKNLYIIFIKVFFYYALFSSFILKLIFFVYNFFKIFLNFISSIFFKIKYIFYFVYTSIINLLKKNYPSLYNFLIFSKIGYIIAVFYFYFVVVFPFLQFYENFNFSYQFETFFDSFTWYGNLIDIVPSNYTGWFFGIYDAGDFFLIKIIISFIYFLIFIPYFRNVWFKEEDWETTFVDSEFDNDEMSEEEDDFDDPYVESDNIINQGEEVLEYYDELRSKSFVNARINNYSYANGHIITNDLGWGFYIIFWLFTFYYSIKMFFWPNFLFFPYISLLNFHAKSTMYAALIPSLENYIHSNFFVYNNWLTGSPLKHNWYYKNYNNINVSESPEELIWNRPKNYNWTLWNDLYTNFADKYYLKKKPKHPNQGEAKRFRLYNAPTNLGFLDYYDSLYNELTPARKKTTDRFELKRFYGIVDTWNEIYLTYPLANKNINLWKRSVLGFRNQLNGFYNNGYNFLNFWPKKDSLYGLDLSLNMSSLSYKNYNNGFDFNVYKKITNPLLQFNHSFFGINFLYINFIYKRDVHKMSLTYNLGEFFSQMKALHNHAYLLYPSNSLPMYTTIANITVLPYFRKHMYPISYDYGLDSIGLDNNIPFWLFLNSSVIHNYKSSSIFFDLLNYFQRDYTNNTSRLLLLKLWYEYNEGLYSVSRLYNKKIYPLFFYDMQHSPFSYKYDMSISQGDTNNQELSLIENENELEHHRKTRFFNYADPKSWVPILLDWHYNSHMDEVLLFGRDFPAWAVKKSQEYGYIIDPDIKYLITPYNTFEYQFYNINVKEYIPFLYDRTRLARDLYPFDFLNYSSNFNSEKVFNLRSSYFDKRAHFMKNFFAGFNVELKTSKETSFLNYYNKYFKRKEGINTVYGLPGLESFYRKRKEIHLHSIFDSFFNMKTYDKFFLYDFVNSSEEFQISDMEDFNFSDITRGLRQLPLLYFDNQSILSLNENELTSISPHSLAKENYINIHLIYLKYLNFNNKEYFVTNFYNLLNNSALFSYWYNDYIFYILNNDSESGFSLPYQFYIDNLAGVLYKKEEILLLDKFTLFQTPYSNIFFLVKVYNYVLNFFVYIIDFFQFIVNKIYALDLSIMKKGIMSLLNFLFYDFNKMESYINGYFYIFDDSFYNDEATNIKFQILNDFRPYSLDFSHEIETHSILTKDIIIPYSLKTLKKELKIELLSFFLQHREMLVNFEFLNAKEKNNFHYPYLLKGNFLYDILLVFQDLKNSQSLYSNLVTLDEFSIRSLFIKELYFFNSLNSEQINILIQSGFLDNSDFGANNSLLYLNDYWVGDISTWYLLTYDLNFFNIKYNSNFFNLFLNRKYA